MASSKQLLIITLAVVIAVVLPSVAQATEYIVGDDAGWKTGVDYEAWAKDKMFMVGDTLVFKYPVGAHNVFKVDGPSFKSCTKPVGAPLATGNDVITLAAPGNKWYFCGIGEHCAGGQKLKITVWPSMYAPAPAPNSAHSFASSAFQVLAAAMISTAVIIGV